MGTNPRVANSKNAAFIRAIKAERGKPIEEDEQDELRLSLEEQLYWDAFNELTTQRTEGESGPQPLPVADIVAYGYVKNFDAIDFDLYLDVLLSLDREYLRLAHAKILAARQEAARKAKRSNGRKT